MKLPHMRYPDLRRRLHNAYLLDSQGVNPDETGDPKTEYKLAERLRQLTEDNFRHLMEHIQWDLRDDLTSLQYRELVDYAIFLRVHMGEEATCDPRDYTQQYASPSNLGPIATGHKV